MRASQKPSVDCGEDDHDRDEHCSDAIREALDRRLAGLRGLDEPGDLRQRSLRADTCGPHDQTTGDVDRGPDHGAAGGHVDGDALTGQQRRVDSRLAFLDDTVGGDPLAGQHRETISDAQFVDGPLHVFSRGQHDRGGGGAEPQQGA